MPKATASQPKPQRRSFFGSARLPAAWRALGFFVLLFATVEGLAPHVLKIERTVFGPGETPGGDGLEKIMLFACTLLPTLAFGFFERRSLAEYGLPLKQMLGRDFWVGALWGFCIVSTNVALMVLCHAYSFGAIALSPAEAGRFGLLWLFAYLAVGMAEEFAFRGYLQFTLTQAVSFWPAAVLTSILFGLIHLDVGASWPAIANYCALALFACLAIRRTGTLWFAIGTHMAFDWADSFFYSTGHRAVQGQLFHATVHGRTWLSGGIAGPDGNIFNVVLVAASILLLSRLYPRVKYPPAREDARPPDVPSISR